MQHGLSFTFAAFVNSPMPTEFLIALGLLVPAAIQAIYLLLVYGRFAFTKAESNPGKPDLPISIIVCGRNEEENFKMNLPLLLAQQYPNFEVIAINNQSVDGSKDVLEALQDQHPKLRMVDVQENDRFWRGKKFGLTLGIKAASYEHLLFIDADCKPAGVHWLREMASAYAKPKKEIILGFGAYNRKPGLLNMLVRFETLQTAIQYFARALWGNAYMGVGRNMGYTRNLFYAQKGFMPHMHISMGDDDLFVNSAATKQNTACVFTKESFTYSEPETTFGNWFRQKRRHLATSKYYRFSDKLTLGLFGGTVVLYYLSIVAAVVIPGLPVWIWYGLGARMLLLFVLFAFSAKKTGDWDILMLLPFLELFLLLNQLAILVANLFNTNHKWK
jgi:cellulose synthase/poly-beta-1,6-N-acetylglucosamine synthase-like glycosyltransferase